MGLAVTNQRQAIIKKNISKNSLGSYNNQSYNQFIKFKSSRVFFLLKPLRYRSAFFSLCVLKNIFDCRNISKVAFCIDFSVLPKKLPQFQDACLTKN